MNEELQNIVRMAGAPEEVMDQLWFHVFCQNFTNLLLTMAEEEVFGDA
jgi:hypothetical protein